MWTRKKKEKSQKIHTQRNPIFTDRLASVYSSMPIDIRMWDKDSIIYKPETYLALQSAHSLFSGSLRSPSNICTVNLTYIWNIQSKDKRERVKESAYKFQGMKQSISSYLKNKDFKYI